ncbi:tRNA uridine-5-carboxymethylaminomethyl(34) synthesis GTPase MnmE [Methylocapsa palsarum]|nr:tRNA uridine-5-carboxymethylaminomethyl(34) synthesis GTPase MnmE [Methylocapsa palsarum]
MSAPHQTIYAAASGAGRAAIAIVRLSGPRTRAMLEAVAGAIPQQRTAKLAALSDPATGEAIDKGLLLFFPAPRSFTGEDYAEFHVHGGRAVLNALFEALGSFADARPAEPGEFTRRALLNGKMDLGQAEGIADIIDAETEWQRRQAFRQTQGVLGERTAIWRATLLEAAALMEAEIDFSDEGDVTDSAGADIAELVRPVLVDLRNELRFSRAGEMIREGLTIVIAGPPNAGKSTLLNALARRDVAIVSAHAGTTRDALEVHLDLDGCAVTLIDTAGLRESGDEIERIGMARAREKARSADLVLWLTEAGEAEPFPDLGEGPVWSLLTKRDHALATTGEETFNAAPMEISARSGRNLDSLIKRIGRFAVDKTGDGRAGIITKARHRKAFEDAAQALERIVRNSAAPVELRAEDLRSALFCLQRLTGAVDVEDILGEIFSRFCIGK